MRKSREWFKHLRTSWWDWAGTGQTLSTTCSNSSSSCLLSSAGRWVLSRDTICRWKVGTGGGQVTGERRRPEHLGTWAGDNRRRPGEAGQCQDTCTCPLAPDPPTYTSWVDWGGSEISWSFCTIQKKANDIMLSTVCSWNRIERVR